MIILLILTASVIDFLCERLGECTFLNLGVKGLFPNSKCSLVIPVPTELLLSFLSVCVDVLLELIILAWIKPGTSDNRTRKKLPIYFVGQTLMVIGSSVLLQYIIIIVN